MIAEILNPLVIVGCIAAAYFLGTKDGRDSMRRGDPKRELGLPDDESKGSTHDWRFICEWIEKRKNARATWDRMENIADKSQERAIGGIAKKALGE
jgi:hypothetical protein